MDNGRKQNIPTHGSGEFLSSLAGRLWAPAVKIIRRGYQVFVHVVLHDILINPIKNGGP